ETLTRFTTTVQTSYPRHSDVYLYVQSIKDIYVMVSGFVDVICTMRDQEDILLQCGVSVIREFESRNIRLLLDLDMTSKVYMDGVFIGFSTPDLRHKVVDMKMFDTIYEHVGVKEQGGSTY